VYSTIFGYSSTFRAHLFYKLAGQMFKKLIQAVSVEHFCGPS